MTGGLPITSWSPDDVAGWLSCQGLAAVAGAFKANGVTGSDLTSMTYEDMIGLGCPPFQAKKVQGALLAMGIGAAPSAPTSPTAATGFPTAVPPPAYAFAPPSATGFAVAAPPPAHGHGYGYASPLTATAYIAPAPAAAPSKESQELAELKAQVAREALKNDLRKEMDVAARLAATEAMQRISGGPACAAAYNNVNNNNNSSAATSTAGAGGWGAPVVVMPASPRHVLCHEERYCGPISWIIGCCLFPCICFCPGCLPPKIPVLCSTPASHHGRLVITQIDKRQVSTVVV